MVNLTTVNVSTETSLVPFLPHSPIIYFYIVVKTASLKRLIFGRDTVHEVS